MTSLPNQPQNSPTPTPAEPPRRERRRLPRGQRRKLLSPTPQRPWPNHITIIPASMKRYVLDALHAGADDDEIAETTGLEPWQVAGIQDYFGIAAVEIR
jgi:hypothetical protein